MDDHLKNRGFRKPVCSQCGKELPPRRAEYDQPRPRVVCDDCEPIQNLKENWKPLGSGSVSRVFIVKDRPLPGHSNEDA